MSEGDLLHDPRTYSTGKRMTWSLVPVAPQFQLLRQRLPHRRLALFSYLFARVYVLL